MNPWSAETWDPIAQSNYIRKHGMARAVARAHDAGTTVHGAPPRPAYDHKKHVKDTLRVVKRRNALRGATPTTRLLNVHMDLGYVEVDVTDIIDQEIDIILNPGDISFGARFKLGASANDIAFGLVQPIFPGVMSLGFTEAPNPQAGISPGVMSLGVSEAAPLDLTKLFSASINLGLSEEAIVGNERRITVSMSLGAFVADGIKLNDEHVVASASLGLTETASISFERDIAAASSLGLTESATVQLERDLTATFSLGVTETAIDVGAVRFIMASMDLGISEAASTQTDALVAASMGLGIAEAAATYREADLTASLGLGVTETQRLDASLLPINMSLGVTDTVVATLMANLASTHSLGASAAVSTTTETSIVANAMLGASATLPVYGLDTARDTIHDMHLGIDMNVQPYLPFNLPPVSMDLGVSEAASTNLTALLNSSMGLGFTQDGIPNDPRFQVQFLQVEDNNFGGVMQTTNVGENFGAASDYRWILITVGSANNARVTSATIGGVAATLAIEEHTGKSSAILYAKVPTGGSGNIVINWATNAGSVVMGVYRIISFTGLGSTVTSSGHSVSSYSGNFFATSGGVLIQTGSSANAAGGQDYTFSETDDYDRSSGGSGFGASHYYYGSGDQTYSASATVDHGGTINSWCAIAISPETPAISAAPAPYDLGITEAAILSGTAIQPTVSEALGISMSSSLIIEQYLTASAALGLSEAASVTTASPKQPLTNLTVANDATGVTTSSSTISLASKSIGTAPGAGINRWVIGVWEGSANPAVFVSAAIGGNAATLLASNTTGGKRIFMVAALVNSGTTATFDLTVNVAQSTTYVLTWYTMNGDLNTTPLATLSAASVASFTSQTLSSVKNGGLVLAAVGSTLVGGTPFTWSDSSPAWTHDVQTATWASTLRESRRSLLITADGTQNLGDITGMGTTNASNVLAVSLDWVRV